MKKSKGIMMKGKTSTAITAAARTVASASKDGANVEVKKRQTGAGKPTSKGSFIALTEMNSDSVQDLHNLEKFDHIVVLMMENRSFDHILGYLTLEGDRPEIDGLTAGMSNIDSAGKVYPVHHERETAFLHGQDPCHEGDCVDEQTSNNNGGFVTNYARKFPNDPDPSIVMGYYNAEDLPVYHHLANQYTICNRWFCSVAGSTWPNRLYSLTGRCDGLRDNRKIPIYDLPSFVRHLDANNTSWRWYSHIDLPTLSLLDGNYRLGPFNNFAFFNRRKLFTVPSFLDDAANGNLPAVSWIDPSFVNDPFVGVSGSNDDHPPSDILHGQELVLKLYNAVVKGPKWSKTLLIVVYDEHGGFFDHVPVPEAIDDDPDFCKYGVRVPSFIISPYVEPRSVSNTTFDHTSVIKTILLKFCMSPDGSIPDMGARVNNAKHLGSLLTLPGNEPREGLVLTEGIQKIVDWRTEIFKSNLMLEATGQLPPEIPLNELQEGLIAARNDPRMSPMFDQGGNISRN